MVVPSIITLTCSGPDPSPLSTTFAMPFPVILSSDWAAPAPRFVMFCGDIVCMRGVGAYVLTLMLGMLSRIGTYL